MLSDDPDEGLASYVDRYLTEGIAAEGLARNLPGFARFLQALAEEGLVERSIVVCREDRPRRERGIEIWPLEFFLGALWHDGL